MSDKDKTKRTPITVELAAMAQQAYKEQAGQDMSKQGGQPAQLALKPGWGGQNK